jgi:S-formylglutathione hydrolase
VERIEQHASCGGRQEVWRHASAALGCDMRLGVYLPPQALAGVPCPAVYWLSGLTCTEQNFITKAGAQAHAARLGLVVVAPDTSPRGPGIPDDDSYDLGQGAGFYLNAARAPWAAHFRMEDYVTEELPALVERHFPVVPDRRGISGHSMGGHGALTLALRHPGRYQSVSAFAPICAPSQVGWGRKAFAAYLGDDEVAWQAHDAVALLAAATERLPLLVDQGEADEFLATQLRPDLLSEACRRAGHPLELRLHGGYDHSYYFIASFLGEHLAHHARALQL